MVVQAAVVVERALPVVGDVRLVPDLEVPPLHRLAAEAPDQVVDEPGAQLLPARVVPWGMLPEAVDLVALLADVAAPARGLDLGRDQVPREEPQLDHRPETRSGDRVVDLVDERPVVDRRPVGRFLVDVRRAASRLGQAVAAGQRVVITNVIRDLGQLAERPVERLAARRVGPVDLVVADAGPDAAERSPPVLAVDPNARVHGVRRKRIVLYSRCRADPRGEMSAARSPSGARRVRTATPAVDRRRGCEGRPPDGWTAMPPTS